MSWWRSRRGRGINLQLWGILWLDSRKKISQQENKPIKVTQTLPVPLDKPQAWRGEEWSISLFTWDLRQSLRLQGPHPPERLIVCSEIPVKDPEAFKHGWEIWIWWWGVTKINPQKETRCFVKWLHATPEILNFLMLASNQWRQISFKRVNWVYATHLMFYRNVMSIFSQLEPTKSCILN